MNELRLAIDSTKLAIALAKTGLTITDLSKKANISRVTMQHWLNSRTLNAKQVNKLANALGVEVTELI